MYVNKIKRKPIKLRLGKHYVISFGYNNKNKIMCKFIQTTRCGFNFLNLDNNRCLLKRHLYPSKCENHLIDLSSDWFWINENMNIVQCG